MTDRTEPATPAGRALRNRGLDGDLRDFIDAPADLLDDILAIEAEAATPISREALADLRGYPFHGADKDGGAQWWTPDPIGAYVRWDDLLAALPPAPEAAPSESSDRLRAIVKRTASMGLCSQTHHEHLAAEALAALATAPAASPAAPDTTPDFDAVEAWMKSPWDAPAAPENEWPIPADADPRYPLAAPEAMRGPDDMTPEDWADKDERP